MTGYGSVSTVVDFLCKILIYTYNYTLTFVDVNDKFLELSYLGI